MQLFLNLHGCIALTWRLVTTQTSPPPQGFLIQLVCVRSLLTPTCNEPQAKLVLGTWMAWPHSQGAILFSSSGSMSRPLSAAPPHCSTHPSQNGSVPRRDLPEFLLQPSLWMLATTLSPYKPSPENQGTHLKKPSPSLYPRA